MSKPYASVSLDLDNLWSYMKTHGDAGWESFPSYLDLLVPRVLALLGEAGWRITFFIVGQDAALESNHAALRQLVDAGHEIGNHSFHHEPWLHLRTRDELDHELGGAEEAIRTATGVQPRVFRGPGFSCSNLLLEVLHRRGYLLDASTLPTWIGPLARQHYFLTASLSAEQRQERALLFGGIQDMWRPVSGYRWRLPAGELLEIPVTTVPVFKVPFHLSYVLYLSTFSERLARLYFRAAFSVCRVCGVQPSLLLHPLDFLGGDEVAALRFFPAMDLPGDVKRRRVARWLHDLGGAYDVITMGEHAARLQQSDNTPIRRPDLPPGALDPQPPGTLV